MDPGGSLQVLPPRGSEDKMKEKTMYLVGQSMEI